MVLYKNINKVPDKQITSLAIITNVSNFRINSNFLSNRVWVSYLFIRELIKFEQQANYNFT